MDEEKYVILRSEDIIPPSRGDIGATREAEMFALRETRPMVKLEEAELTKRERNDIRRDPRTRAIAMLMPMKLIAPISRTAAVTATQPWGVEAVRAPESPFD